MNFLEKLDFLMNKYGLNKRTLSQKSDIPYTTIDNWYKRGYEGLKLTTLRKLNDFFNTKLDYWILDEVTDPNYGKAYGFNVNYNEMEHIKKYRELDDHGKKIVDFILDEESTRREIELHPVPPVEQTTRRLIQYYQRLASAGSGQIVFDDLLSDLIEIPNTPEYKKVQYAIGVNGKSMEPEFYDGDILLVEPTKQIEQNEIGIFIEDGNSYVKKLGSKKLISLNGDYPDIPLTADTECFGRVVGKTVMSRQMPKITLEDINSLKKAKMKKSLKSV